MKNSRKKTARRNKIKRRIRATIKGTPEKPRLTIYKSNTSVYLQIVDDTAGNTLMASKAKTGVENARAAGKELAAAAAEKGINNVVFDRSGYKYHGIIKAVAEGARDGGLQF